ncbi:MAG: PWI domain-containing protein, partial [Piptocephalis tieghemiana]
GTSAEQDGRFGNKEQRLLRSIKFPASFSSKVNMTKVNLSVIRPWVSTQLVKILGIEDEVVTEFVFGLLEADPDPRMMQVNLTGFLGDKTPAFMKDLWELLLSAQSSPGGIPARFIEEKKEELRKKKVRTRRSSDSAREPIYPFLLANPTCIIRLRKKGYVRPSKQLGHAR